MRTTFFWVIAWVILPTIVWVVVHRRATQHVNQPDAAPSVLDETVVERYRLEWGAIRARFGTFPGIAVAQADELLSRILRGGDYARADRHARVATMALGVELGRADRKDLKRLFDHYASILDDVQASFAADEIALDPAPRKTIDLRTFELDLRRGE